MTRRAAPCGVLVAGGVLCAAACSGGDAPSGDGPEGRTAPSVEAPVTYASDGDALTLLEDGTFRLRVMRSGAPAHALGTWSLTGGSLSLRADGFELSGTLDGEGLRVGPASGDPAAVSPGGVLARAAVVDRIEEPMELRGMMVYLADAGSFTACATGTRVWIAPEGDARALEGAYLDARHEAGEPVLVRVVGTLTRRPGMEGGDVDALVVERFVEASPGVGCEGGATDRPLEGVDWVLEELPGGAPVPEGTEAFLRLEPEGRVVAGSSGCNRFSGGYELSGPRLTLGPTAMTRMACGEVGRADVERDFVEALRLTGSARVSGDRLELIGETGVVARLRARAP